MNTYASTQARAYNPGVTLPPQVPLGKNAVSPDDSISQWMNDLKAGDSAAAQKLWERYFAQMVRLARKKLQDTPRRAVDEEDVALSAFASFCRGAERGLYPQLHERDNLWRLLVAITARKAYKVLRDQGRQKRGGGTVRGESALLGPAGSPEAEAGLDQVIGPEPTPEFAAQLAEEYERLLASLGDPELRRIALAKMEGHTTDEIAAQLNRSPRTVERKLELIRSLWEKEMTP